MKFRHILPTACVGLSLLSWPIEAVAGTSRIIATYYQDDQMLVDDHQAEFEVVSSRPGSPMLGETIRIIRWSNGTITTINVLEDAVYMGGYPATTYGVGFIGGRVYEAYCAENTVGEKVCYKFM